MQQQQLNNHLIVKKIPAFAGVFLLIFELIF